MGHLIQLSIDVTKINKSRIKNGKYVDLTISIDDQTDKYFNSVSCWENQTKEEREVKANKNYLGNGKVVYTKGDVHLTEKKLKDDDFGPSDLSIPTDELPF
jgi:hypothetical protein